MSQSEQNTLDAKDDSSGTWNPFGSLTSSITSPWGLLGIGCSVCICLLCIVVIVFFLISGSASGNGDEASKQIAARLAAAYGALKTPVVNVV